MDTIKPQLLIYRDGRTKIANQALKDKHYVTEIEIPPIRYRMGDAQANPIQIIERHFHLVACTFPFDIYEEWA